MTLLLKFETKHFHFENLYKLNDDQTPRISTRVGKTLVGIDPQMLENFINDVLFVLTKFAEEPIRHLLVCLAGTSSKQKVRH